MQISPVILGCGGCFIFNTQEKLLLLSSSARMGTEPFVRENTFSQQPLSHWQLLLYVAGRLKRQSKAEQYQLKARSLKGSKYLLTVRTATTPQGNELCPLPSHPASAVERHL